MQQGSQEWLEFRMGRIGSSDIPSILNLYPFCSRSMLLCQKAGLVKPKKKNKYMIQGSAFECIARQKVSKILGEYEPYVFTGHKDYSFLMASVDGVSKDKSSFIEIKCPSESSHLMFKESVPIYYRLQMSHIMFVSGIKKGYFVSLFQDDVYIKEFGEELSSFFPDILSSSTDFYNELVELKDFMSKNESKLKEIIEIIKSKEHKELVDV